MQHKVHKYYLVRLGKKKDYLVYACALPNCNHTMPKDLIQGKLSVCWNCSEEFTFYPEKNLRIKLICQTCKNPQIKDDKLDDLMLKLGIE